MLFDFDGVILESAEIKTDAFRDLFSDYPAHVAEIVQLHLRHSGISRHIKFEMIHRDILRLPFDAAKDEELGRRFEALVMEKVLSCQMVPGARDVLDRFTGRLPMALISGTPGAELAAIVRRRGLERYFDAVHGSPPAKREWISRLLLAGRWQPERVVMVGDGLSDFEAARDSGVHFVGRVTPRHNPFSPGTPVVADLTSLVEAISALLDAAQRELPIA